MLAKLTEHFRGNPNIAFVAVQTLFRGHEKDTLQKAVAAAKRFKLDIPVGHDPMQRRGVSRLMDLYRTGGTPWSVFIDKAGTIRFAEFFVDLDKGKQLLTRLANEEAGSAAVGKSFGEMRDLKWFRPKKAPTLADHKLTLFRWWRENSKPCKETIPALTGLWQKYRDQGLNFVPVHHRKTVTELGPAQLFEALFRLGFDGQFARDLKWHKLRQVRGNDYWTRYTSISLLVDAKGVIRWVHPGPSLHPSKTDKAANASYRDLEKTVQGLLKSKPSSRPAKR